MSEDTRSVKAPSGTKAKIPRLHSRWFEAHSIAGLAVLIPLFVIMFTGTIAFFRSELVVWHTPALRFEVPEQMNSVDKIIGSYVGDVPREAQRLAIVLPNDLAPALTMRWFIEGQEGWDEYHFNPNDGSLIDSNAVSTRLAELVYQWHYLRPLPMGLYISGFIALLWFASTISGVYIHRKKLLSQFTGWSGKGPRAFQSWLHSIAGTLTLPLHVIYGATGALFGFNTVALALVVFLAFGGDQERALEELLGREPPPEYTEERVDVLPLFDPILEHVRAVAPEGAVIQDLSIERPFDTAAELHAHYVESSGKRGEVTLQLYEELSDAEGQAEAYAVGAMQVLGFAIQLHFGHVGGYVGRAVFFIGGVALIVLTYAGARLWVMRKSRDLPRATSIVERLFDGFGLGVMPAVGIYAWANRLLPDTIVGRGIVEEWIFHGSWALIGIGVFVLGTGPRCRRWMFRVMFLLLGLVPILDGVIYGDWLWSASSWVAPSYGGTNLALILFAAIWLVYEVSGAKRKSV